MQTLELADTVRKLIKAPPFRERLLAFTLAFLFFAAFTPRMLDYLRPTTGDETFYLITTQSILQDGDLDETNQFKNRSWEEFYPTCEEYIAPDWKGFNPPGLSCTSSPEVKPEATKTTRPGLYSKHGLGLSVIIAPAYALGGRLAVMFLLNAIAALLVTNIFILAWESTGSRKVAWLCWVALGSCSPIFSYAYLIFPQLTAALCVIYAYRRARFRLKGNNGWQLAGVGLCLGMLPWLHNLYLILSLVLAAYLLLADRERGTPFFQKQHLWGYVAFFVPALILGGLYVAYLTYLYGVPLPNASDHSGFNEPWLFPLGFLGLLFDQKYGLLMYSPLYLIPIAWLGKCWLDRRNLTPLQRSEFKWLLIMLVPYYLVVADYGNWWGQWCPPARYLLPVVPLLTVPLAQALTRGYNRFMRKYVIGACLWGGVITLAFILNPTLSYHWEDTQPAKVLTWLETHVGFLQGAALGNFFPGYVNIVKPLTPVFWFAHVFWLGLAVWLGWQMVREKSLKGGS